MRAKNKTEKVIFVDQNKKYINKNIFQHNFKEYIERNSKGRIDFDVTLHMFRHSYASHLRGKLELSVLAEMFGDDIKTFHKVYCSMIEDDKIKASGCISAMTEDIEKYREN